MRLLVLLPIMVFVLFPFYWVIVTSFKSTPQISANASIFWPQPVHARAVPLAALRLRRSSSGSATRCSSPLVSTVISVAFAALAAYALARLKFLGAGLLTSFILITYLLPGTLLFIPLYQTLSDLGHHQHLRRADLDLPDLPACRSRPGC